MSIEVPATGTYSIDPTASEVSFACKHMFGTGTVKGTFDLTAGSITIADPPTASSVTATVDAASVATKNPAREKVVRSGRLLGVDKHPAFDFASESVTVDDSGAWTVDGTLTVKGVGVPTTFTVTSSEVAEDGARIVATGRVDRYAHGITGSKGMVGRYLDITIEAEAVRS